MGRGWGGVGWNAISATWHCPGRPISGHALYGTSLKTLNKCSILQYMVPRDSNNLTISQSCFKVRHLVHSPIPFLVWGRLYFGWHMEREQESSLRWERFQKQWRQESTYKCPQPTHSTSCSLAPSHPPWGPGSGCDPISHLGLQAGTVWLGRISHLIRNEYPQQITQRLNST